MKKLFPHALFLLAGLAHAAPVSPEQARVAAENWLKRDPSRFDKQLHANRAARETATHHDAQHRALFHVVNLEGGGFVVTSADTRAAPVIAFSGGGFLDAAEGGPLWDLLAHDLAQRAPAPTQGAFNTFSAGMSPEEKEWDALLNPPAFTLFGMAAVDSPRRAPLLKTKWHQDKPYNSFAPNAPQEWRGLDQYGGKYPIGCAATAAAQIMRFHNHPASIPSKSCAYKMTDQTRSPQTTTSHPHTIGGAYEWLKMPFGPKITPDGEGGRAVGKVMMDFAAAVGMDFVKMNGATPGQIECGGSSIPTAACLHLRNTFGYPSTLFAAIAQGSRNDWENAILADLNARRPLYLALGGGGGHGVVADGYGYVGAALYVRVHMGWGQTAADVWYNLPEVNANAHDPRVNNYTVNGIIFNIIPGHNTESVTISGRVLFADQSPAGDASVIAVKKDTGAPVAALSLTCASGVYAVVLPSPPQNQTAVWTLHAASGPWSVSRDVTVHPNKATQITESGYYNGTISIGNRHNENLVFPNHHAQPPGHTLAVALEYNNGATPALGTMQKSSAKYLLPDTGEIPPRPNHTFKGWFTAASGGTEVTPATTVARNDEHTLHAQWISLGGAANNTQLDFAQSLDAAPFGPADLGKAWSAVAAPGRAGGFALQSGPIADNEKTAVSATVSGPGALSFWWKVSSEPHCDLFTFHVNGAEAAAAISGETGWEKISVDLPAGPHALEWSYEKDGGVSVDWDCAWLAEVVWTPEGGGNPNPPTGWFETRDAAMAAALASGKKVLLMAGRDTCPICGNMRNTVLEHASIKPVLEAGYVLWFCDIDNPETALEYWPYTFGLGSFNLPLMCVIDPSDPLEYLDRTTGAQTVANTLARLLAHGPGTPTPAIPAPPANLAASSTHADRVALSWAASAGATSYKVFRNTANNSAGATQLSPGTTLAATAFNDTAAVAGTAYYYWVKACNSAGDSAFSAPAQGLRVASNHHTGDAYLADPGDLPQTPAGAGAVYDGFVYDANGTVRGTMTLTAKAPTKAGAAWTVTAKVLLQTATVSFSKPMGSVEEGFVFFTRTGELLQVALGADTFTGTLSGGKAGGVVLNAVGSRNKFADKKNLPAQAELGAVRGLHNLALLGNGNAFQGFLTLNAGNLGAVKIAGKLADGTSVSGSAKLLAGLNLEGWHCVALHRPLYSKKGFIGGLLWINPAAKQILVDTESGWFVDWLGKDFVLRKLDVLGGWFGNGLSGPPPVGLAFSAAVPANLPPPAVNLQGAWAAAAFPDNVLLELSGTKLSLPKDKAPKKGPAGYDYSGANPSVASISYTAKTGLFKGSFKLYFDNADASVHKVASVSYSGVMVPAGGKLTGLGMGATTVNKQKHNVPVEIK